MLLRFKSPLLLGLNAGWIVPFYLCAYTVLQWFQLEASPLIQGVEHRHNSFPFLGFAQQMLMIACIWLGMAIVIYTALRSGPAYKSLDYESFLRGELQAYAHCHTSQTART